jgi:hypothetical protein
VSAGQGQDEWPPFLVVERGETDIIEWGAVSGSWGRVRRRAGVGAHQGFSFYPMGRKGTKQYLRDISDRMCKLSRHSQREEPSSILPCPIPQAVWPTSGR